jgi:outer membrane protein TolC
MVALLALALAQDLPSEPIRLTLRQAVHEALKNNSELEVARFEPWIQEQTLLAAYGAFDHVVFSTGQTGRTVTPGTTFFSGAPELEQITHSYTLGVRRRFPFGLQAEIGFASSGNQSNSTFALLNPTWQNSLGLQVTLPILRGAWVPNELAQIYILEKRRRTAVENFETALLGAVHGVETAYHELIFAAENEQVARRSLDLARRLVQENERKLAQGQIIRLQVTEAQVQAAQREQDLLKAEQGLKNAVDRLRRQIDPARLRSSERPLVPADSVVAPGEEIDEESLVEASLAQALERRADYRASTLAIESAEIELARAKRESLPRFDLTGRAAMVGVDDAFPAAFSRIFRFDSHELMGGFSFDLPVENRAAKHAALKAELEVRRARAARVDLESRIILEVREAVRDIATRRRTLKAADEQLRLAEERQASEEARHRQGATTTYFLLVSQNDLNVALLNRLRARIDLALSRTHLKRVRGSLLDDYDIKTLRELEPRDAR